MRRSTLLKDPAERIMLDFLAALAFLAVVAVGLAAAGGVIRAYQLFGLAVLLVPVGVVGIWVIGHVVHGVCSDDAQRRCKGCEDYKYGNIFTEYFHKKKCLPLLMKQVHR